MFDFTQAPERAIRTTADMLSVLRPERHGLDEIHAVMGFAYDSRSVKAGDVFVAIKGARTDGHQYISQALERGAVACLIDDVTAVSDFKGCILVEDTVNALGFLAAAHRRAHATRIVAITGSVGKTTTKELVYTMFSNTWRVKKSEGNFNSTIGLPIQLLQIDNDTDWFVAEMGMSTPGEIAKLMRMAKPEVGVWTRVAAVHMINFEDLDGIARAKAEMVDNLDQDGIMVYNADDPMVTKYASRHPGPKVPYGFTNPDSKVSGRIMAFNDWEGTHFQVLRESGRPIPIYLPLVGRFNVYNGLAACAVALATSFPLAEVGNVFGGVKNAKHRCQPIHLNNEILLVDDTYNSSPVAVEQVLRSFAALPAGPYRWLILGDMLELGPEEIAIHADMGRMLASYGFDRLTLVGPFCRHTFEAFQEACQEDTAVEYFPSTGEAILAINANMPKGARVWVKASRGMYLERLVEAICTQLQEPPS
jgi:UDP-N-acetylmuramoyl-tripeptide--D-alanyl-D-alanine ligase